MAEKVIVTGAAGFIGSHLVDRLLARGDEVIGVDNFNTFYSPVLKRKNLENALAHRGFSLFEIDIEDASAVKEMVEGASADVIVHLAARAGVRPSIEDPILYAGTNEVGTTILLEQAKANGIDRFVFGSSSSVYGKNEKVPFSEEDPVDKPISPYAASKRASELLCYTYHHLFSMKVTCLRFFTVYGPRQRPDLAISKFARRMMMGESIPVFGDGTTSRDYTFINDIIDGVIAAIDRQLDFEIINLGESRTISLNDLIVKLESAIGVKADIERLPLQPGDVPRTFADISKAADLLGYDPGTTIEQGIGVFVDWLKGLKEHDLSLMEG